MSNTNLNANGNVDTKNSNPAEGQVMVATVTNPPQTVEQEYIIDPEFENLLPAKTPEQYTALKETIRCDGRVRDPVVVWDETGILLDGHHRDRICKELNITPPTVKMSFASREDAKLWVIRNQLTDRRNLNTFQSVELALKSKAIFAAKAKANQRAGVSLKSGKGVDAGEEVAKLAGASPDTVRKVERILEKADEVEIAEAINALRNGDAGISISSVYQRYCVTKKMEIHPLCKLFREASEEEMGGLVDSIRRIGLLEPIVLYEGKILDGKIRYKACEMAGIEHRYEEYKGVNPLQFVMSKNYYRNHLSEEQRTLVLDTFEKFKNGDVSETTLAQVEAVQEGTDGTD